MTQTKNIFQQSKRLLLVAVFSMFMLVSFGQNPPPPPGGDGTPDTKNDGNQLGGSAHIGGGVILLLALGLAYGGKRFYELRKEQKEEVA